MQFDFYSTCATSSTSTSTRTAHLDPPAFAPFSASFSIARPVPPPVPPLPLFSPTPPLALVARSAPRRADAHLPHVLPSPPRLPPPPPPQPSSSSPFSSASRRRCAPNSRSVLPCPPLLAGRRTGPRMCERGTLVRVRERVGGGVGACGVWGACLWSAEEWKEHQQHHHNEPQKTRWRLGGAPGPGAASCTPFGFHYWIPFHSV